MKSNEYPGADPMVMKFGGTSVADAKKIEDLYEIVVNSAGQRQRPIVVVVSALAGVTDMLFDLPKTGAVEPIVKRHKEVIADLGLAKELLDDEFLALGRAYEDIDGSARTMDSLVSFGEVLSSRIVATYFKARGTRARAYTGHEAGIVTDSNFGNAEVLQVTENNIKKHLAAVDAIPVVAGFIAKDEAGNITTLGRGGSDYTAALIGAALNVTEIQIWTDVDGVLTTDPNMVSTAKSIPEISFREAAELAYFGAKVLHPKTIHPAVAKNIPVRILNTARPEHAGTIITPERRTNKTFTAISFKKDVTVVRIYSTRMLLAHGFLAKVFEVFAKYSISVDMISTSEVSISMTLDNTENLNQVVRELGQYGKIQIITHKASICVVGASMIEKTNIAGRVFAILGEKNINIEMISQGASPVSLNFLVDDNILEPAVRALHLELFEKES